MVEQNNSREGSLVNKLRGSKEKIAELMNEKQYIPVFRGR